MVDRRKFLTLTAASLAAPVCSVGSARCAEGWPTQGGEIVVGFEPGGATDIIARTLAERLKEVWGQPVAVENKPGAGGNVAAELVAKAEPDGHTIFIVGPGQALNKFMYPKLGYDPVHGLRAGVAAGAAAERDGGAGLLARRARCKEFIEYCKANPGKATYASSGVGTSLHLCGELFEHLAGVQHGACAVQRLVEPALREFLPGRIDVIFDNVTSILPHVMSGGARGLAVTTARRIPAAPNLPTLIESGVAGLRRVVVVRASSCRRRRRTAIVAKINNDVVAALAHDKVKAEAAWTRLRDHRLHARPARQPI